MSTNIKVMIDQTDAVVNVKKLLDGWREVWGRLDVKAPVEIVLIVQDVLAAVGMDPAAVRVLLGPDGDMIDDQARDVSIEPQPGVDLLTCSCCESPAVAMVQVKGSWRMACAGHARIGAEAGCDVIEFEA